MIKFEKNSEMKKKINKFDSMVYSFNYLIIIIIYNRYIFFTKNGIEIFWIYQKHIFQQFMVENKRSKYLYFFSFFINFVFFFYISKKRKIKVKTKLVATKITEIL